MRTAAVDAVKQAAAEFGLTEQIWQWVPLDARSFSALASAFVGRYVQAYGPVVGLIDIGRAGEPRLV